MRESRWWPPRAPRRHRNSNPSGSFQNYLLGRQELLLFDEQRSRGLDRNLRKLDIITRSELADAVEICGNHVGYFWISSCGLLLHKKNNRRAFGRDLDSAERYSFSNHALILVL